MKAKHQNISRSSMLEEYTPTPIPTRDQIAAKAESLWRDMGQPESRDEEIWLEAERQLRRTPVPRTLGRADPEERMDELEAAYPDPSRTKETTSL
ncbi:MAG TPA: DUF2934 domain-containing protein [Opitutaceae bacterium]|jgi:hypothetical protein